MDGCGTSIDNKFSIGCHKNVSNCFFPPQFSSLYISLKLQVTIHPFYHTICLPAGHLVVHKGIFLLHPSFTPAQTPHRSNQLYTRMAGKTPRRHVRKLGPHKLDNQPISRARACMLVLFAREFSLAKSLRALA